MQRKELESAGRIRWRPLEILPSFMKRAWLLPISLLAISTIAVAAWRLVPGFSIPVPSWESVQPRPEPNAVKYKALCEEIETRRVSLAERYRQAKTDASRRAVEDEARQVLETKLPEMMRCWLGTPWDFNGISTTPGEGKIACGYFVSTLLRDAGFRIERVRLAQQASQNIIGTFLDRSSFRISSRMPYDAFAKSVRDAEEGISIVGLDSHVAFLVNDADEFRMIHSSGASPWCVVDESSAEAIVLQQSSYRVVGHLTSDRNVLRKWLSGEAIPVQLPKKR
jgi:hypothetical protein